MDAIEKMAADIALTMNGGEWKDGKWYSKGHREAWIKAVQPYADEIERLREAMVEIVCLIGDRDRRQEVMDIAKPYAIQQLALKGNRPHVYLLNEDNQG